MSFAICHLAMMPMRREAKHSSEMVSMILFGESFNILETKENWHYIQCSFDAYEGWISCRRPRFISLEFHKKVSEETPSYNLSINNITYNDSGALLSPGSKLPLLENNQVFFENGSYPFDGENVKSPEQPDLTNLDQYCHIFLNAPYLWGGRSIAGIDCSGFTQIVLRFCGIKLPRDAWQQAETGTTISSLDDCQAGDLAFFSESGTKVSHVGILLGNNEIAHASEYVRIDGIDEKGIFNRELQEYTMKPVMIRRYL